MKFVHIGIVVRDINTYLKNNVISNCSEIIYDEIQDADICFVENKTAKVGIELIQPKSNNSTVYNFLQKILIHFDRFKYILIPLIKKI